MKWTSDGPTVPGWYWLDNTEFPSDPPDVVHVWRLGDEHFLRVGRHQLVENLDDRGVFRWAGPIEEPESEG